MKIRILSLLVSAILVLSLFAGCDKNNVPAVPSTADNESKATVSFTDDAGRTVEVPTNITRVSPSGALAQMFLLAIAPDLLITTAAEYTDAELAFLPSYISDLPVVGQFYGSDNLNYESIAAISPEIVIDVGEPKNTIVEDMDSVTTNLAIPSVHITAALDSSPGAFRTLGKLLGRETEGENLALYCEEILAQTADIMNKVGVNKTSALYCLGDGGLNVLAATSFHSEVLDYITDNMAVVDEPSSRGTGNETDLEQISVWNPSVILFAPNSAYADVASNATWKELDAVRNDSYYEVPHGPYNWMGSPPSINRYLGMIWMTKLLYPEYATFDLFDAVAGYYELFYHHTLTVSEFDTLTANSL